MPANSLVEALLAVQKSAPALQKDAINPHFKNKYISLDSLMPQILPLLNAESLVLMQFPTHIEGAPALRTRIEHAPTGEWVEDTMPLLLDKQNSQGQGSAITYSRRYALLSILGLVADQDDDGEKASNKPKRKSDADLKREVMALAKKQLDKDKPSAKEVAELFKVEPAALSERATLERILAGAAG